MRDKIFHHLSERPTGATPDELFELVFAQRGSDAAIAAPFVQTLLAPDRRFHWHGESGTWRLALAAELGAIATSTFVVLDLETTDLGTGLSSIIEIGAVRVVAGKITAEFEQLLNPGVRLSPYVARLTGIDDALLARQPILAEVWPRFSEFIGDDVLVAHNGAYDFACLNAASLAHSGRTLENPQLCTFRLARQALPETPRRGLDALAAHYGIPSPDRHRALGDARITAEILLQLAEDLSARGITETAQLLVLQNCAQDGQPFSCPLPPEKVEQLPAAAGVYRFFDQHGALLYIGRARNLRERVGSYLNNSAGHSDKTLELIRHSCDVRVELLGSELEAAIEEAAGIHRERPPYNRLTKHLPRIAFVRLTLEEPYPRLAVSSRFRAGAALQLGPFRKRRDAERAVSALTRLYQLRTCPGMLKTDPATVPCWQADVHACTAPCAERVDRAAYQEQARACAAALGPDNDNAEADLMQRAHEVTQSLSGESAARLHSDLQVLRKFLGTRRSFAWLTSAPNFAVLTPADEGGLILGYAVRRGELILRARIHDESEVDGFAARIAEHWQRGRNGADAATIDGLTILAAWLRDRRPDEGCVFALGEDGVTAEMQGEWRSACAGLLGRSVG